MTLIQKMAFQEKGTTPLHVAARAGQSLQLELLIANGGNPNIVDLRGHTPAEIARYVELYCQLWPFIEFQEATSRKKRIDYIENSPFLAYCNKGDGRNPLER